MRLLFACEYYHPSRGGVQEVMRQIAERMVAAGHDVTVATTRMPERDFRSHNGVKIEEFDIHGNLANGLKGEVGRYQEFLKFFDADAIMIKAAQQWTFDAAWPVLDAIKARKVFIPCGFSGLYERAYRSYFRDLPAIMSKFDSLIFYAESYRDVNFAHQHGLTNIEFLPNGASEIEFDRPRDLEFRRALDIEDDAIVVLSVGSPIAAKGHAEVAAAFSLLEDEGRKLTLVLNGNWASFGANWNDTSLDEASDETIAPPLRRLRLHERAYRVLKVRGWKAFLARAALSIVSRSALAIRKLLDLSTRAFGLLRARLTCHSSDKADVTRQQPIAPVDHWVKCIERQANKRVLRTNLPRDQLIQAFLSADVFVFASNVEYSPLVLFEACAAGLPFVTVPVGNAEEIVRWTGGGIVCPADKDKYGYTRADPAVLRKCMERLLSDPELRAQLGAAGRDAWRREYNWAAIAPRYEAILAGVDRPRRAARGA